MEEKYFVHQIKHTNGVYEKGIVVKDSFDGALQTYHAYLGAYAYGHDANTDYVQCSVTDMSGNALYPVTWARLPEPEEVTGE